MVAFMISTSIAVDAYSAYISIFPLLHLSPNDLNNNIQHIMTDQHLVIQNHTLEKNNIQTTIEGGRCNIVLTLTLMKIELHASIQCLSTNPQPR